MNTREMSPEILLANEDFRRLLKNGPANGIYVYIFADLKKTSDQYFQLIESIGYCALIRKDKIVPQAQTALISQIKNMNKT
jgi:hypothetical protein